MKQWTKKLTAEGSTFNYTVPTEGNLDSLFIFPQMDPVTLEVGLFLDSKLYEHFEREYIGDAEQHLVDFSLALINNVHVLYQQSSMTPNLDIVIVRFELWKKQPVLFIRNEEKLKLNWRNRSEVRKFAKLIQCLTILHLN